MASAYAKAPAGGPDDDGKCKACGGSGKSKKPSSRDFPYMPKSKGVGKYDPDLNKRTQTRESEKNKQVSKPKNDKLPDVKPRGPKDSAPKDIDKKKEQFKNRKISKSKWKLNEIDNRKTKRKDK